MSSGKSFFKKKKKKKSPNSKIGLPGGSAVKSLPAMQKTRILSLGWEVPLEKGMATLSSILDWTVPWTEEPGGLQSMGSQTAGQD